MLPCITNHFSTFTLPIHTFVDNKFIKNNLRNDFLDIILTYNLHGREGEIIYVGGWLIPPPLF